MLFLMGVCALAVTLAVAMPGRAINPPGASGTLGFGVCAPPCWAGITVGQTPLADVSARFEANIPALQKQIDFASNGAVYWGVSEGSTLRQVRTAAFSGNLLAQAGANEVTYIHLNLDVPLWYLLLTLGDPLEVEVHQPFPDSDRVEMVLHWLLPGASAAATLHVPTADDWGVNATASSLTFALPESAGVYGRSIRSFQLVGRVNWQGFVPFARYVDDAAANAGSSGQI